MASRVFAYVYTIDADTFSVADVPPYTDLTASGATNLMAGSPITTSPTSLGNLTFDYEAPNGFVATGGGVSYWFSDVALNVGDVPNVVGSSYQLCFLAGTLIATPGGGVAVEHLAIGDLVVTADGRTAPVKWMGVQTVVSWFADPLRSFPVRITAGAFGESLPVRDLFVSPDHALFLDGLLVQAGALVNGTTIVRETAMPERFTYFHVELDDHALILAECVPAETFLDTVTRRRFDNFADYAARYGDAGPVLAELPVPRIKSARQLPAALREQLAARAGAAGTAAAA
jgi:hypothetical protein